MSKYNFRLEKIVSPLMEKSYYEVLSKPVNISLQSISLDEFFLNLSYRDCFDLIRETFLFLKEQSDMRVSINVNHKMLNNSVVVEYILREANKLKEKGVYISLELNEHCMGFINVNTFNSVKEQLSLADVDLWLDDFGCGSANFSSIIDNRFSVIKIDKKIFWDFYNRYTGLLVELISYIKSKHCLVVIEGVESQDHLNFALENGCYSQGYLLNDIL